MSPTERVVEVNECDSCGDLRLAESEVSCCDGDMTAVDGTAAIRPPEVENLMQHVFGISATELDVCHCVMKENEATIREITAELDRDRSVITRHLNHLVEIGVVEKHSRTLSDGGRKNVYSSIPVDEIRQQFTIGLYAWLIDATDIVDELSQEKIEAMTKRQETAEDDDGVGQSLISRLFGDRFS